jgi:4-amino-4-deoxy-L-arabinose transferase-like glycosyltransferase
LGVNEWASSARALGTETRYIRTVRELLRKSPGFFLFSLVAAFLLRLFFLVLYPHVTDDSRLYADIAKNWLFHGVYGITDGANIVPTYARLPGYPAFLGAVFRIFGTDNYHAVLWIQLLVDLFTCFVVADIARRLMGDKAARVAFLATAVCPFLANYCAAALTETLEVFFTAIALDLAIEGASALNHFRLRYWVGSGFAVSAAILLRPDGGLLLVAIGLYLGLCLIQALRTSNSYRSVIVAGVAFAICSTVPLIPWTVRNLHTLHRFEPLTPRYANNPEDFVALGFNRWVRTWMADYVSVEEIYWNEPGEKIDWSKLPSRAFDSEQQKQATIDLLEAYNQDQEISPELDARFGQIGQDRVRASRFRYYVKLPMLRILDMWLRPRTELLPPDPRWWEFTDDLRWMLLALGLGALNITYLGAAIVGTISLLRSKPHRVETLLRGSGLLILFIIVRSLFLGSLENPEPRYTLECYPAVIVLAAACWQMRSSYGGGVKAVS